MIWKNHWISGTLGAVSVVLTYIAISSLGSSVMTIIIFLRDLAPRGRAKDVLGITPIFIPGILWAVIAVFAWAAVFALYKQEKARRE